MSIVDRLTVERIRVALLGVNALLLTVLFLQVKSCFFGAVDELDLAVTKDQAVHVPPVRESDTTEIARAVIQNLFATPPPAPEPVPAASPQAPVKRPQDDGALRDWEIVSIVKYNGTTMAFVRKKETESNEKGLRPGKARRSRSRSRRSRRVRSREPDVKFDTMIAGERFRSEDVVIERVDDRSVTYRELDTNEVYRLDYTRDIVDYSRGLRGIDDPAARRPSRDSGVASRR